MITSGAALWIGRNLPIWKYSQSSRLSALSSEKINVIFWYGNVQGYESERDDLLITDDYYTDNVYYVTKDFDMEKILDIMENNQPK